MNAEELYCHLMAYSETYAEDSAAYANIENKPRNAAFALGKSEAFATAAAWLLIGIEEGMIK